MTEFLKNLSVKTFLCTTSIRVKGTLKTLLNSQLSKGESYLTWTVFKIYQCINSASSWFERGLNEYDYTDTNWNKYLICTVQHKNSSKKLNTVK